MKVTVRTTIRRPTILSILCWALLLSGCGGTSGEPAPNKTEPLSPSHPDLTSENAYPFDSPVGATELPPETFAALLDRGEITLVTRKLVEEHDEEEMFSRDDYEARAIALYADRPDVLQRHSERPDPKDPSIEALPNGDYLFDWRGQGNDEEKVVVHGPHFAMAELVHARESFHDLENQRAVYGQWYERIDADVRRSLSLPTPEVVRGFDLKKIIELNHAVAQEWPLFQWIVPCLAPTDYPASWTGETGSSPSQGGDASPYYSTPSTSLWAQKCFPLKYVTTRVRSQGRRGSCVSFGITGAVEAMIRRDHGEYVNLSEQFLYGRAKQIWFPSIYGDGLHTLPTLATMQSSVFRYPFEQDWDYNPSWSRVDVTSFYVLSCDGYMGEMCSDANHQAEYVCTSVGGWEFCAYVDPAHTIPASSGYAIGGISSIQDPGALGVAWAKASVALGIPVVFCFSVPQTSLSSVSADGYVPYIVGETAKGGHCTVIVGWVENADLPAGAPPSIGNGYFIVKNSWGTNFADGGYVYVPDTWVSTWGTGMYTISGVAKL